MGDPFAYKRGELILKPLFFGLVLGFLVGIPACFATQISQCGTLNTNGTTYTLAASFTNTTTGATACLNITGYNIVLDCLGYNINGTQTTNSYGVQVSFANQGVTIQNCNLTRWYNAINSVQASYNTFQHNNFSANTNANIRMYKSNYTTMDDNTINASTVGIGLTTSSDNLLTNNKVSYATIVGYYIYANSDRNNLTNNVAKYNKYGVEIDQLSNLNTITGGSIENSTTDDYYVLNGGMNNNFTNTNFSTRTMLLSAVAQKFGYKENGIWLSTNGSNNRGLTRTLYNMSQYNITFAEQDMVTAETLGYQIEGLALNTNYTVYNFTALPAVYVLNSSSTGSLYFTLRVNTTPRTIMINATEPAAPPVVPNVTSSDNGHAYAWGFGKGNDNGNHGNGNNGHHRPVELNVSCGYYCVLNTIVCFQTTDICINTMNGKFIIGGYPYEL